MHLRYLLALAVASVSVVGCGDDQADPAADVALHARVERSRLFETQRQAKLVLRNDGGRDVVVEEVLLDSPLFETGAAQDRGVVLRPGQSLSLPVDIGPSRCEGAADGSGDLAGAVALRVEGAEVRLPFEEPDHHRLADLQAQECEVQRLRAAVDVRFGEDFERTSATAVRATLEVEQVDGRHSVVVDEVRGSVIFGVTTDGAGPPLLTLEGDEERVGAQLAIGAERCDPHALIESKRTFAFPAFVRLDGGPVVRVDVVPEGALRAELEAILGDCL